MLPFEDDPLSSENLMQDKAQHFCKLWRFANELGPPVAPAKIPRLEERRKISHIDGLACEKNFTLHILAVDSVRNHHFAEFLGLDIVNKKDMTAAVILDTKVSLLHLCYQHCIYLIDNINQYLNYFKLLFSLRHNTSFQRSIVRNQ